MKKIAFYDTKNYDRIWFDRLNKNYEIKYFKDKLTPETAILAGGCDVVVPFVNDTVNGETIDILSSINVGAAAMRCAGYNNVDLKKAKEKNIMVYNVPEYSPYAVAEYAMGLLLTLNRKIHRAYIRTKNYNFSIDNFLGTDLHGKTAGIIGTGKIGRIFADICEGFGMKVLCSDPYPIERYRFEYVSVEELAANSDFISLHCPLTESNYHMIGKETFSVMKKGAMIINTSRGGLVSSEDLLEALKSGTAGGAALDVYDEERDYFYEDFSEKMLRDETMTQLLSMPNVIITSHQGYMTNEALKNIAEVTLGNIDDYFNKRKCKNEVAYRK